MGLKTAEKSFGWKFALFQCLLNWRQNRPLKEKVLIENTNITKTKETVIRGLKMSFSESGTQY